MKRHLVIILWLLMNHVLLSYSKGRTQEQSLDLTGQVSGWLLSNDRTESPNQLGMRFIPEMLYDHPVSSNWQFSSNAAINIVETLSFHNLTSPGTDQAVDLYRLWVRLATRQFEVRAGLQKINFGSALILRPLMWFDRLDPRDPLQLTDGVYGLLARYYFLSNANLWCWGLYRNENQKGWEIEQTDENHIEYGGRIQYPFARGEVGFTYHRRPVVTSHESASNLPKSVEQRFTESRYAVDTKWDLGIGLWLESALIYQDFNRLPYNYQQMSTLGMDYTIDIGNGMHALLEHMRISIADQVFREQEASSITAMMSDYPLSVMDQFIVIVYYDWENHDAYRFLHWQRLDDDISLHIIGFMNPSRNILYNSNVLSNPFSGKGFQIMIVYNF